MPAESNMSALVLQRCAEQMQTSLHWFTTCVLPLSLDQLRWHPRIGSWSIGECLDHLNLTLAYYLPKIEQSLIGNSSAAHIGDALLPFPESELEYLRSLEPPVSLKVVAPPALRPTAAVDPDRIVDQFGDLRERFATMARNASSVDLAATRISGSLHPPVQSVGGVLAMLSAHDRRHIWQADAVRRGIKFPL